MSSNSNKVVKRIYSHDLLKYDTERAIKKYNENPDFVRIYFNSTYNSLIVVDSSREKTEINFDDGNILFLIGGSVRKKEKLRKTDIIQAINDELEYWHNLEKSE